MIFFDEKMTNFLMKNSRRWNSRSNGIDRLKLSNLDLEYGKKLRIHYKNINKIIF